MFMSVNLHQSRKLNTTSSLISVSLKSGLLRNRSPFYRKESNPPTSVLPSSDVAAAVAAAAVPSSSLQPRGDNAFEASERARVCGRVSE